MDYKEKYEELVEAARAVVEGNPGLCDMNKRLGRVRDLLPEKESEDERIKNLIYCIVRDRSDVGKLLEANGCPVQKALSWLEKQKDYELTEEDRKIIPEALVMLCNDIINHRVHTPISTDEEGARKIKAFLKTFNRKPHKTKEEWGAQKEDERIRKEIIAFLQSMNGHCNPTQDWDLRNRWLPYLENQKEPHYTKRNTLFDRCVENCDPAVMKNVSGEVDEMLQKEQKHIDYPYVTGWRKNRDGNKPALKHSVLMLTTHGVAEGEWLGEKWCQYRWSCELKDNEILYWIHLSDLTQLEKEDEIIEKEQKPVEWSEEDYKNLARIENLPIAIAEKKQRLPITDAIDRELLEWLKPLRPFKQEWSEEDESFMQRVISVIGWAGTCTDKYKIINPDGAAELQNWLKSLRPQPHWKPSEELMNCLMRVITWLVEAGNTVDSGILADLKKQLETR